MTKDLYFIYLDLAKFFILKNPNKKLKSISDKNFLKRAFFEL